MGKDAQTTTRSGEPQLVVLVCAVLRTGGRHLTYQPCIKARDTSTSQAVLVVATTATQQQPWEGHLSCSTTCVPVFINNIII